MLTQVWGRLRECGRTTGAPDQTFLRTTGVSERNVTANLVAPRRPIPRLSTPGPCARPVRLGRFHHPRESNSDRRWLPVRAPRSRGSRAPLGRFRAPATTAPSSSSLALRPTRVWARSAVPEPRGRDPPRPFPAILRSKVPTLVQTAPAPTAAPANPAPIGRPNRGCAALAGLPVAARTFAGPTDPRGGLPGCPRTALPNLGPIVRRKFRRVRRFRGRFSPPRRDLNTWVCMLERCAPGSSTRHANSVPIGRGRPC